MIDAEWLKISAITAYLLIGVILLFRWDKQGKWKVEPLFVPLIWLWPFVGLAIIYLAREFDEKTPKS